MTRPSSRHVDKGEWSRVAAGAALVLVLLAVVGLASKAFAGGFVAGVPVTVLSPRAGLVMNPDAKVKMLGVEVGKVDSIEPLPGGQAAVHLSIEPSKLQMIPANVQVDIASTTVFGAKFIQLVPAADSPTQSLQAGQIVTADKVTVEFNTVFEQLTKVLGQIDPAQLNKTLGVLSRATSGRGQALGQSFAEFDKALSDINPALPDLQHSVTIAPDILNTYADAAPDLLQMVSNVSGLSQTIVAEQSNLDALLLGVTGLAATGNQFLTDNAPPLANLLQLLIPTTTLTDEYHTALTCGLKGMADFGRVDFNTYEGGPPTLTNLLLGRERYRYPSDLPKVGARGGPRCEVLPVQFGKPPRFVVTDIGANPLGYGNPGPLLNSDGLKQMLFGPIAGPPRNSGQIGQPG